MRNKFTESLAIPSGIHCSLHGHKIVCEKSGHKIERNIAVRGASISLDSNNVVFNVNKSSKREFNLIQSQIAHIRNMFLGLEKPFVYHLEACNVHFPMTLKVEKDKLTINNFLGEKTPRFARIHEGANVDVKGQKITITSIDKEAAGKTAASFEKATKVRNRDRRIFQDGIFITQKPGRDE